MAFLAIAPTGTVLPFAGTTAPDGWLLCDGTEKSRTTYAKLFAVIADTYGVGDGSTTFNVPDMRGVFPRGSGTNGTANYGGVTGHTPAGGSLAAKGGQKTATNGLSGTAAGQSQGTSNIGLASGSAASGGVAHTHGYSDYNWQLGSYSGAGYVQAGSGTDRWDVGRTTGGASAYNHGHSVSGTTNIAHTHGSSSVTVASADSETAPASLSLNYIIKL